MLFFPFFCSPIWICTVGFIISPPLTPPPPPTLPKTFFFFSSVLPGLSHLASLVQNSHSVYNISNLSMTWTHLDSYCSVQSSLTSWIRASVWECHMGLSQDRCTVQKHQIRFCRQIVNRAFADSFRCCLGGPMRMSGRGASFPICQWHSAWCPTLKPLPLGC